MHTRKQLDQNFKVFLQSIEKHRKKYFDTQKKNSLNLINNFKSNFKSNFKNNFNNNFKLVAVSKTFPINYITELYQLGQHDFAENYLDEALEKINFINNFNAAHKDNLSEQYNITWHYIGKIQSKKAKKIAQNFDWVQSVDRLDIAKKLNAHRSGIAKKLNILIQVNIENDPNKSGVTTLLSPSYVPQLEHDTQGNSEINTLIENILQLDHLNLRGLMCILKQDSTDYESQYSAFSKLRELQNNLNTKYNLNLDTLSMGMSGDYKAAIAAGSTMIRVGSALFGPRGC